MWRESRKIEWVGNREKEQSVPHLAIAIYHGPDTKKKPNAEYVTRNGMELLNKCFSSLELSNFVGGLCHSTLTRFIFVGLTVAAMYFLVFYMLLRRDVDSRLAGAMAYLFCFGLGYAGQKLFTFQSKTNHSTSFSRYALVQFACLIVSASSGWAAENFGIARPFTIALITTSCLGIIAYFASAKWVFRQ